VKDSFIPANNLDASANSRCKKCVSTRHLFASSFSSSSSSPAVGFCRDRRSVLEGVGVGRRIKHLGLPLEMVRRRTRIPERTEQGRGCEVQRRVGRLVHG